MLDSREVLKVHSKVTSQECQWQIEACYKCQLLHTFVLIGSYRQSAHEAQLVLPGKLPIVLNIRSIMLSAARLI